MSKAISRIAPTGRLNRREKPDTIGDDEVLSRLNMMVVGSKHKFISKLPGSDRLNSTAVSTGGLGVNSAFRYYTKANYRRTFFFSNGTLYFVDDLGNTTQVLTNLNPLGYPVTEIMRVSAGDRLYFADGQNGMYSYDGNNGPTFTKEEQVDLNPVQMISWLDRLWVFEADSDDLHFSVNQDPTDFTDSTDAGIITVAPKRGSSLIGFAILNETLYLFKQDGIYYIEGRTPEQFGIREVCSWLGCPAGGSIQNVESGIVFLGSDYEFYSFNGTQESIKMLTYTLAMSGDFTKNLEPLINKDRMVNVCSIYHNKIYRCAFVGYTSNVIYNDYEYCFNTINETDFLTYGNNVGAYLVYDKFPDKQELLTGRSDTGLMMYQYRGFNWDNQGTSPSMKIELQTKFIGLDGPVNLRLHRFWLNDVVLKGNPINIYYFLDGRFNYPDASSESFITLGETTSVLGFPVSAQNFITSRATPKLGYSRGQSVSLAINEMSSNREFAFSSIDVEFITKGKKQNEKVGQ